MRTSVRRGVLCSKKLNESAWEARYDLCPNVGNPGYPSGRIAHSTPLEAPRPHRERRPPSYRQGDQAPDHAPTIDRSCVRALPQATAKIHVPARAPVYTDLIYMRKEKRPANNRRASSCHISRIRQSRNQDSQPPCEASELWTVPRTARWTTAARSWLPSARVPLRKGTPATRRPFR